MPYDQTTIHEPFWAKSGSFSRGRDPLGVENSSFAVVATLLPGLTNLTQRIRYYGFYCWLLAKYEALSEANAFRETHRGQYTFIRRAELIIAYTATHHDASAQAVIGSDYPAFRKTSPNAKGYYDISSSADFKTKEHTDVYWSFSSGGMGQYYAGAMIALGLFTRSDDYFFLTDEGKALAKDYASGIEAPSEKLLLSIIQEGRLFPSQREELLEFILDRDIYGTAEWSAYRKMIIGPDAIASTDHKDFRRQSLKLFLEHIASDSKLAYHEMPVWVFDHKGFMGTEKESDTSIGWYLFYLNELLHVALQGIFYCALKEIEKHPLLMEDLIETLIGDIPEDLSEEFGLPSEFTLQQFVDIRQVDEDSVHSMIDELFAEIKQGTDPIQAVSNPLLILLSLYQDHEVHLSRIEEFSAKYDLTAKRGSASWVMHKLIRPYLNRPFHGFMSALFKELLMGHVHVAYSKMGGGEKNLLKFIIEDGFLIHIETMTPGFTNPRLHTVRRFMRDLGMLDKKNALTAEGHELLNELRA